MIAPSRRSLLLGLWREGSPEPPGAMVAWIRAEACLARTGCATCVERCPAPGALVWEGMTPVVDPRRCTGCGDCAALCPAPTPTIHMLARRSHERPSAA